jgi:chemotaxis protein CheC
MPFMDEIKTIHLDILKEIGNIGAGNAATALSTLLNQKVDMSVPKVEVVSFNEMMELVGGPENVVVSIYFRIDGDAPGSMYFVMSLEQATSIISRLIGDSTFTIEQIENHPFAVSAIQEVGNILIGSYVSSLSDFTQLNLHHSVPSLSIDMFGAIISYGLMEIGQVSDVAIVVDTVFFAESDKQNEELNGHFFLLPDPNSFTKIFSSLGISDND